MISKVNMRLKYIAFGSQGAVVAPRENVRLLVLTLYRLARRRSGRHNTPEITKATPAKKNVARWDFVLSYRVPRTKNKGHEIW